MSTPDLVSQSTGVGVQSVAIALLIEDGTLPRPDVAIFADTGWEPAQVYRQVDRIAELYSSLGVDFYRVSNGDLRRDVISPDHRFASIPYYIQNEPGPCQRCNASGCDEDGERCRRCRGTGRDDGKGIGRRQCTSEYKLAPIARKIRELLGAKPPAFRRIPRGRVCEQWIGFSTDEIDRANRRKDSQGVQYLTTRYPLLELGMSRRHCLRLLADRGWGDVVKSACIGCPFHGNRAWRDLRDNNPDEWADAVALDAAIRGGGVRGARLTGDAYLHPSRVPLDQAPIDRPTREEINALQGDLLELLEEGDPDGCSPYGCRRGPKHETNGK